MPAISRLAPDKPFRWLEELDNHPIIWVPAAGLFIALIVWMATTEWGYLLPAALLVLWYVSWSFRRPIMALSTIILSFLHNIQRSEGITLMEVAFGAYFFGYIAFWFFKTLVVQRQRVLRSAADYFLMGYLSICLISVVLILSAGGSVQMWFRELMTEAELLLFFPAREALKTTRDRKTILNCFLIVALSVAVYDFIGYKSSSAEAAYLWQLVMSRKVVGSHYFVAMVLASASLFAAASKPLNRILFAGILVLFSGALALTFSRGFWIAAIFGFVILFFLMNRSEKAWAAGLAVFFVASLTVLTTLIFGQLGEYVSEALADRFVSSASGLADVSVAARWRESADIMTAIQQSPLVGHGIGATFRYYKILDQVTVQSLYAHNAYLFLVFKVGLIGALLFFGYFYHLVKSAFRLCRQKAQSAFDGSVSRVVFVVLLGMMIVATNSGILVDKEALLIISLCAALTMSIRQNNEEISEMLEVA